LVRTTPGPMGAVSERVQPTGPIAAQPAVDGLAADPVAVGDLDDREPVPQDFDDGVAALLCHGELQEHAPDLLASTQGGSQHRKDGRWGQQSTGTLEPISRYQPVKHQPDQHNARSGPSVSKLSATLPHPGSCRTPAPRPAPFFSSAYVVSSKAAEGLVTWCGWHGMQDLRRPGL